MTDYLLQSIVQKQYDDYDYEYIVVIKENCVGVGNYNPEEGWPSYVVKAKPVGQEEMVEAFTHIGRVVPYIKSLDYLYKEDYGNGD
jgi:hypothetical protein